MRGRRSSRGFTLIELMITVAIIGILAAIAIPQYTSYIFRAKRTEALTMIGTIKVAQETHRATRDCYVPVTPNPPGLASPLRRDWSVAVVGIDRPCTDVTPRTFQDLNVRPNGQVYYTYACTSQFAFPLSVEYACSMIGDLDGDGESEIVFCTDNDGNGACIPSITGVISNFTQDPIRVSVNLW